MPDPISPSSPKVTPGSAPETRVPTQEAPHPHEADTIDTAAIEYGPVTVLPPPKSTRLTRLEARNKEIEKKLHNVHINPSDWHPIASIFKHESPKIISSLIINHGRNLLEKVEASQDLSYGNGNFIAIQKVVESTRESLTEEASNQWDELVVEFSASIKALESKKFTGGMRRYYDG